MGAGSRHHNERSVPPVTRGNRSATRRQNPSPPSALFTALEAAVPQGVRDEPADRLAVAHDASHFLLTPRAVVTPTSTEQVAALMRGSARLGVGLTFRSGGTSLSGQAVTEGVLVDTRRHFGRIEVLGDATRVRVGPGATLRQVNARLAPYGRKLGPDPASESACTIGGVVANNSSGMACGIEFNSYRTLESMVFVLSSGTTIDTGKADADECLRVTEPALYAGLIALRDRLRGNAASVAAVRRHYSIKNTMGYGLNAFLDHSEPVDILSHLIVGSEGTLAFVAEVTFRTIPLPAHAATALLVFDDLATAMGHLGELTADRPATVELLDAASLRVAQHVLSASSALRDLTIASHAAFLVEYQDDSVASLRARVADGERLAATFPLSMTSRFTDDLKERAELWHMRKGLYASVASDRPPGSNVLLEDIAVPIEAVAETCDGLIGLFDRHGYGTNIIFGHAKDGNLHFTLNEWLTGTTAPTRYQAFTEDLVDLVLSKSGSLKAEHGTGRMMAPFVRRQFGDELYEIMVQLKRLCDPDGLLNPGVIITDDPSIHTRDFKITLATDPEVDRCVECGFCEPVCPSRNLTTTPRQRIVLRREMARAAAEGDEALLDHLRHRFAYDGLSTCAVDGMCQTACPVEIDTGQLVRRLRSENVGRAEEWGWQIAARHWGSVTHAGRLALTTATHLPDPVVVGTLTVARVALGADRVPMWGPDLPGGGQPRQPKLSANPIAVYFPSCIGSMFGQPEHSGGVRAAFEELCDRAGVAMRVPKGIAHLCCGTPWKSKGLHRGYETMTGDLAGVLREATDGGTLPVVSDATSCTEGLTLLAAEHGIHVIDSLAFVRHHVLPRLTVRKRLPSIVLHPTCASTRLGLNDDLVSLAHEISDSVVMPDDWGCCGFAGDRGLLRPELTRSATAPEAAAVARENAPAAYASSNRPCEIAMARATGANYRHLLELVNEATR
jgi:D-lactate dehydrogenase